MSELEDRYRRVLRLLPPSYREAWEDEMVATFLDSMRREDPEEAEWVAAFGRPSRSEVASIAALAVRLRLGGVEAAPRAFAWGQAVRLVALVGLLVNAVLATVGTVQAAWVAGWLPWPPVPDAIMAATEGGPPGTAELVVTVASLLWVAAFGALLSGRRRAAGALAGLALVPAIVGLTALVGDPARPSAWSLVAGGSQLLVSGLVVASLVGFHRGAPAVGPRPWMVAFVAGLPVALLPGAVSVLAPVRDIAVFDWPGVSSLALVAAAGVHLLRPGGQREPAWSLALALLGAAVLLVRVASLLGYAATGAGWTGTTVVIAAVQSAALVAVGVSLVRHARSALQALSTVPPARPQHRTVADQDAP